jgi:hypothetical protein
MCRSAAQGGRRCPGHKTSSDETRPPDDGQVRINVVTNKRSYTVIGGQSRVPWAPGEQIISMEVAAP